MDSNNNTTTIIDNNRQPQSIVNENRRNPVEPIRGGQRGVLISLSLSLSLSLFFFTIILIRAALAQPRPVESIRRFRRLIVPPRPSLERFAGAVQVSANPMRPIGFDGCRCVITRFDGLLTSDAAFLSHFANREQKQNVHTLNALNAPSRIRPDGFHRICMDRLRADSAANKLRNKEH